MIKQRFLLRVLRRPENLSFSEVKFMLWEEMTVGTTNRNVFCKSVFVIVRARTERDFANCTLKIESGALNYFIRISKSLWSLFACHFDSVTPSTRCASCEKLASGIRAVNNLLFGTVLDTASWAAINNFEVKTFWSLTAGNNRATAKSFVSSHVILIAIAWESTASHLFVAERGHIIYIISRDITAHSLATYSFHTCLSVLREKSQENSAGYW